jgi:hypothetical protein
MKMSTQLRESVRFGNRDTGNPDCIFHKSLDQFGTETREPVLHLYWHRPLPAWKAEKVAAINMIGNYTSKNFSITADGNGKVEITDPTVPNGGSVKPGPAQPFPQQASICRTSPSARRRRLPTRRTAPAPAAP